MFSGDLLFRGNLSGNNYTITGIDTSYRVLKVIMSPFLSSISNVSLQLNNTSGSNSVLHLYGNDLQLTTTGQSNVLMTPNSNIYSYGALLTVTIADANVSFTNPWPDTKAVRVEHYSAINNANGFGTQKISNSSGNFDTITSMKFQIDYGSSGSFSSGSTVELWGWQ